MANPNIFSQYAQPVRSVADYTADADRRDMLQMQMASQREMLPLQLEGQRRQNAMAELLAQQQREQLAESAEDRRARSGLRYTTPEQWVKDLYGTGRPALAAEAAKLEAAQAELAAKRATAGKDVATTRQTDAETAAKARAQAMQTILGLQSPDQARQAFTMGVQSGKIGMQEAQMLAGSIPQDPAQFRQWQEALSRAIDTPENAGKALRPFLQTRNTGGTTDTLAINQSTGVPTVTGSVRNTQSPDNAATVAATVRGQNMTDSRMRDANNIASQGNVVKSETDLRKEFADLPEVKRFKAAIPAFNAVASAASRTTPQSDINLVYGLAKLYDPDSVVREGEYATIANSQAIPEWLKGMAQRVAGGGRLTPETKRQIMTEARGRIDVYRGEHDGAQRTYTAIIQQRGGNPANVFTPAGSTMAVDFGALPGGSDGSGKGEIHWGANRGR